MLGKTGVPLGVLRKYLLTVPPTTGHTLVCAINSRRRTKMTDDNLEDKIMQEYNNLKPGQVGYGWSLERFILYDLQGIINGMLGHAELLQTKEIDQTQEDKDRHIKWIIKEITRAHEYVYELYKAVIKREKQVNNRHVIG